MRILIHWFMRNIILLFAEEWGKAQQEVWEQQAIHSIQTRCHTELQIFRMEIAEIEKLHAEARRAIYRIPSAQPLIAEMLQERTQQFIYTVNEQASHKRVA